MINKPSKKKKQVPVLKKLRHKFIFTNMLFVLIVLFVVVFTVSVVNYSQRVSDVYNALGHGVSMAASSTNGGSGSDFGGVFANGSVAAPSSDGADSSGKDSSVRPDSNRESSSDQFVATSSYTVAPDGTITGTDNALGLDSGTARSAVEAVQQAQQDTDTSNVRGHIPSLNLYYQALAVNGTTTIVLASENYIDQNMLTLVGTLAAVSVMAFGAFFLISLFLSRWALRPVEHAWKQQQQFVADASHELKTPLTVIIANNSILMSQPEMTVESQMKWIESTETETHLMQGLVSDMFELARPEDVERTVACGGVDFSDLVQSTVLQFESVAFEHGVRLEDSIAPDLFVEGDASRLQRMVSTLMDNACKYVDEQGSVSVVLERAGATCRLCVTNTGPAIDPEDLPHLFDRFYRSDKARTRGKGGFGLGLSIAKSVVDDHRGSIEASSNVDGSTSFTVVLPLEV